VIHTMQFEYDAAGQMVAANDLTAGTSYDYSYDELGRVDQIDVDNGGPVLTFVPTYDLAGRRTGFTSEVDSSDDFQNTYYHDNLGRLTRLDQEGHSGGYTVGEKRIDFTYDAAGQFTSITRYKDTSGGAANEVAASDYVFDNLGRLTDLTYKDSGDTTIVDYDWAFDAASRITQYVNSVDGTSDYEYDNTDQLTAADHDFQTDEDYTYDENGNRTMTGYSTGDNNQLLEDGTYRYDYDGEGNRTAKYKDNDSSDDQSSGDTDITEYTWDHRNRLVKVTFRSTYGGAATKVVEYVYDHQDRWVAKLVDSDGDGGGQTLAVTDQYVYDGNQIVYVFDGDDEITNRHVWGPVVDQILADEQVHWDASDYVTDDVLWTLTDHLNTVRDLIDNSANVDNHLTYDSYGQVTSETNSNVDTLFLFTARPYDPDTFLQYNWHRWCDLGTGRWMSEDPIGFGAPDANLYRYVTNNSTNATDPTGFFLRPSQIQWLLKPYKKAQKDALPAGKAKAVLTNLKRRILVDYGENVKRANDFVWGVPQTSASEGFGYDTDRLIEGLKASAGRATALGATFSYKLEDVVYYAVRDVKPVCVHWLYRLRVRITIDSPGPPRQVTRESSVVFTRGGSFVLKVDP